MANAPTVVPKPVIIGFFILGLLSSVAFRAIIIFQKFEPDWVRPVWYFGVTGYMIFFLYRYRISQRRKQVIERTGIVAKLEQGAALDAEDRRATLYLVNSIRKSPEDWNYLAIGALSVIAVILDWVL
jgi:hypothetical protein